MIFFKFVISVGGGHCYCSPQASEKLSYASGHHHCYQHPHHTHHLYFLFFNLMIITIIIQTIIFYVYLSYLTFIYTFQMWGLVLYFSLRYHDKLWHSMTKNFGDTYRELWQKSWKHLATCTDVANLSELMLQIKLQHKYTQ